MRRLPALVALALALCAGVARAEAQAGTPAEVAQAFAKTCLASLPGFKDLSSQAGAAGLTKGPGFGPLPKGYWLPERNVFVAITTSPAGPACIMVVQGQAETRALGKAVLSAARQATGGKGKPQATSFFALAEHLPNGSLLTLDHRSEPGRLDMFIFSLSGPVDAAGVAKLMYN